ncbi:MAG: autotransporter outer membrane beta-barrel domain-containing protein [Rhizobiaceae bacterium]
MTEISVKFTAIIDAGDTVDFTGLNGNSVKGDGVTRYTFEIKLAGDADDTPALSSSIVVPAAVPAATTSTTEAAQQQAASNFVQNRNNTLSNIQPDIGGFIDGTFADGGGPLGNFGLRGNEAGFNMSFASSMGKVWSEMARNQSLANQHSAAARADNVKNLQPQASAFLYGQSVSKQSDAVTQTSATSVKPNVDASNSLELESKESAYGSTAKVENTSQLAQARERGYDMWVQVYGAKAHAGNSDSTIWAGYAGAHRFVNDNLIIGGLVQLDWSDESNDTNGSSADGFGWMVGPYIAAKLPDQNLFFDARAAYGRSDNDITLTTSTGSFETERWLASAKVSGQLQQGDWDIRPAVGISYFEETQNSYTDSTNTVIGSQTFTLGEVRFGPTISHTVIADNGKTIRPRFGVNGVWNFAIKNGASSQGAVLGNGDLRARLDFGVTLLDAQAWSIDLSGFYDGVGIDNYHAYGGKARVTIPLN